MISLRTIYRTPPTEAVVLVHGLWMRGPELALLRFRLRRCGFKTYQFSYPTRRCSVADAAQRLRRFITTIPEPTTHFVAHSLGGLVVHRCLSDNTSRRLGRVIALGTPFQGSVVARRLARHKFGRFFLGGSFARGLDTPTLSWRAAQPLGIIAGDLSVGGGRLIGGLPRGNDGTVAVDETWINGFAERRIVHVSHTGLVISAEVARLACHFLATGHFESPARE